MRLPASGRARLSSAGRCRGALRKESPCGSRIGVGREVAETRYCGSRSGSVDALLAPHRVGGVWGSPPQLLPRASMRSNRRFLGSCRVKSRLVSAAFPRLTMLRYGSLPLRSAQRLPISMLPVNHCSAEGGRFGLRLGGARLQPSFPRPPPALRQRRQVSIVPVEVSFGERPIYMGPCTFRWHRVQLRYRGLRKSWKPGGTVAGGVSPRDGLRQVG
jgi:hypothetical protein